MALKAEYRQDKGLLGHRLATWHALRDLADVYCTCTIDRRTARIKGLHFHIKEPLDSMPFGWLFIGG